MSAALEDLYRAAKAADDHFSAELTRAYGGKAGDARYRREHADAGVTVAALAKVDADDAWLAAYRSAK